MRSIWLGLVVVVVAIWSVWPMVVNPARVPDFGSDGWFIVWVMNHTGSNMWEFLAGGLGAEKGLFDANIFFPYKNVLAFSEIFFVSGFWTHWIAVLARNPGVVFGWTMVVGQVLTMVVTYLWWVHFAKASRVAAIVGTIAFGLAQIRWEYRAHLQMWSMQYWLVGTWLFCSALSEKKTWKLVAGAIFLGLQMWESTLPVYFGVAIISTYIIFNFQFSIPRQVLRFASNQFSITKFQILKQLLGAGIIIWIIAWPVMRVYWGVSREFNFQRTIREAAHNSLGIDELGGKFWSLGLYALLVVALLRLIPSSNLPPNLGGRNLRWLAMVLIVGLVMAMGPVVKWRGKTVKIGGKYSIPLPYAAAYYAVPGFNAFRTPSRWIWISAWAASGIIAIALSKSRSILGISGAVLVAIVGGVWEWGYVDLPGRGEIPAVYRWLEAQPVRVVAELPPGGDGVESERMYYSLFHGKRLVNGFSGFAPPSVPVEKYADYLIIHGGTEKGAKGKMVYEDEESVVFDIR